MRALVNNTMVQLRDGIRLECEQGVPMPLYAGTIEGLAVLTPTIIGRHDFAAITATGEVLAIQIVVFEPAVLDFVRKQVRTVGNGDCGEYLPMEAKVRGVVRSLAMHTDWFTGRVADLANQNLANHGA